MSVAHPRGMRCDGMGEVLIMPYYFASADDPGFVFASLSLLRGREWRL